MASLTLEESCRVSSPHGVIQHRDWCWCPSASWTWSRPWWLCPVSSCLPCNPSYNNLVRARSMAGQGDNGFPCIQSPISHSTPAWCLLMSEMLLLNWMLWFTLQLWSLCGLIATLMIYTLVLHLGPSCLSPTALGSTAAAMMTWPRSWQDSICLCLPTTMVSSLKLYLIYSSSGLCWSKCHYSYSAVREEPIKYLQLDINEKGIICCCVKICILNL